VLCAGVWVISVPENNLKYTKIRGKYQIPEEINFTSSLAQKKTYATE